MCSGFRIESDGACISTTCQIIRNAPRASSILERVARSASRRVSEGTSLPIFAPTQRVYFAGTRRLLSLAMHAPRPVGHRRDLQPPIVVAADAPAPYAIADPRDRAADLGIVQAADNVGRIRFRGYRAVEARAWPALALSGRLETASVLSPTRPHAAGGKKLDHRLEKAVLISMVVACLASGTAVLMSLWMLMSKVL